MSSRVIEIAAAALLLVSACSRDPLEVPCPQVAAGEIVVTEIRGPQSGDDDYGEWIELYNASGGSLDLQGALITLTTLDGSTQGEILVREPDVSVPGGGYVVLGRSLPGEEPEHVDYGYAQDFDRELYDSAAIDVFDCDELVDRAIYRNVPRTGTLALDGKIDPPTAEANDDESSWCVDDTEDAMSEESGIRGTPRERNRPCES